MRRTLPLLSALLLIVTPPVLAEDPEPMPMLAPERPYPAVLDAAIEYEGMTTCDPTPRPGALMLRRLLLDTYGEAVVGISRACDQDSISEHKEGRAVDWMVDWKNPDERKQAQDFVDWVTADGPDGTPAANARRLGIMYIVWADEMWRAYDPGRGWTQLRGCYSQQSSGSDTVCHRDHVHFSMTWDGAAGRTSYWDGTPVLDVPCKAERFSGSARALRPSAAFIPVKPVRVFDSRQQGDEGCYLQQRRWSGDDRSVSVRVAGRKGIPKEGVQAVAVRVTAYASNAPGWINAAGTPGANGPKMVSLAMAGTSAGTAIVPVSDTGRIWLATVAGHARVAVDVVGYFGSPPAAAAVARPGTWQATPPSLAADVELPPGSSQDVHLQGVPHQGLTGVSLTLNASGTSPGSIRVASPGAKTRADAVDVVKGTRSASTFAASADGQVTLTNTSQAPAAVRVLLTGLITQPRTDSRRLKPVSADLGTVSVGKPRTIELAANVPADASAVVLVVTTKGAKRSGGLTMWGTGERPPVRSVDVRSQRANTDLALVALDDSRTLRLAGDVKGTATLRLVGVIR